jgi:hypothetical protein
MAISRSVLLVFTLLSSVGLVALSAVFAAENSLETTARYVLETVKAFRTVYAKAIVEQTKRAGIESREHWQDDPHAIMLNVQFIKAAGAEISDFELGLIASTPIYPSNLPKTPAEAEALKKMQADPDLKVLTFPDGEQFKGIAADYAIVQGCADCHNTHPKSPRRDFRQGDLMGAIVVRLNAKAAR